MRLVISEHAKDDFLTIYYNIASYVSIESAEKITTEIYKTIELALTQPLMGVVGIVEGSESYFRAVVHTELCIGSLKTVKKMNYIF
ncbi:type II toxin-antitoxin system RelE/ParE family toxin [Testudinibacter sp. P80/BLE/0925]|uniref:type II toxin-antitoxin system RelE/ParE family toxin n=1 Tax=Testudinibacter sp. TW-1 TaxID=3417757 RepID=UPI003D36A387